MYVQVKLFYAQTQSFIVCWVKEAYNLRVGNYISLRGCPFSNSDMFWEVLEIYTRSEKKPESDWRVGGIIERRGR